VKPFNMIEETFSNSAAKAARPLILLGAGGHAKVLVGLVEAIGRNFAGVCDPVLAQANLCDWRGIRVLGDDSALARLDPEEFELVLGFGPMPNSTKRAHVFNGLMERGYHLPSLVHPSAFVDRTAAINDGAQVMAGAIIQADCSIGMNAVVNTGASIDHDTVIERDAHIAPGAVLCGGVKVGVGAFVGASATLLPLVEIGAHSLVAAGSTLARALGDAEVFCPHRRTEAAS
jgi:sugar O-acyltransferase (sialic acid O-acetyltransferase NeuD family)